MPWITFCNVKQTINLVTGIVFPIHSKINLGVLNVSQIVFSTQIKINLGIFKYAYNLTKYCFFKKEESLQTEFLCH